MNAKVLCCTAGLALTTLTLPLAAFSAVPSQQGTQAYIISPSDGAKVPSPVTVQLELHGFGMPSAESQSQRAGHYHLLIDGKVPDMTRPLGGNVKRFDGQTEVSLYLQSGQHTLQLVFVDHNHRPVNPPEISNLISITVE
ncbi:hypothetical protein BTA51_07140 [Hahella sp. CCB-MM4]|uniref:DUF4399 domain-containing protein n=1 Tax=Hahella sp. (strain CCB-MM4) TaxID=1926491 RepID=UPI000BC64B5C|nr:DUF4399 domain-containing protein [Hahella sp. CCB-MM4]OZG74831.1 hypothetical protein BTA51_07140 [Hahella sp. CCB-MM4]